MKRQAGRFQIAFYSSVRRDRQKPMEVTVGGGAADLEKKVKGFKRQRREVPRSQDGAWQAVTNYLDLLPSSGLFWGRSQRLNKCENTNVARMCG